MLPEPVAAAAQRPQASTHLRVMFVIYGLAPAGPERRILELARAFASAPDPIDVHVCVVGDDLTLLDEFRRAGAQIIHVPIRRPWAEWRSMRAVLAHIERHDIRVVNSFNLNTLLIAVAAKLRFGSRLRLVHHLISLWDDVSPTNQRVIWTALKCADHVLCNGQAVKTHVIGTRSLAQPVSVIPNGVDAEHFRPMPQVRARERARLGLAAEDVVVGTIGNIRPVKNIPFLLRAMTRVAVDAPRARLLCVGGGPQLEQMKSLAQSLGLADRVVFTGLVKDVRPWLAAMDVFALCSRQEGNPNVVLQAMAMALPVVSVRVGEVPFVIDGRSGILIEPGDEDAFVTALVALARDPSRCRALGDAGRRRVSRHYSAPQMIASYAALMRTLADE
ncbi:MAG TPA: glycosyltransferase family 4 protein [Vicinamibacterales bacterium]|nr:glycosyltransferase family 4 protein [Vicinamibacterales bacterium]